MVGSTRRSRAGNQEDGLINLLGEEIIQVVFANAVDAAELNAFEPFTPNKFQYGQVMELQSVRDFFGREEPLNHSIKLNLTWPYFMLSYLALQCF